ncbi:unnamed protein product [Clavelina lepadiformis]|uniref:VWFA domain-containing protein n=1 Tax=Clavelina lepadiformis TaxID=159417 RepID=A0ABP0H1F8_CLALP
MDSLTGAEVVYLVDVSGSLYEKDLEPVPKWIKLATKFFYFKGEEEKEESSSDTEIEPTQFGLLTFDDHNKILSSIVDDKTRAEFYAAIENFNHTMRSTYIGRALDFSRLKQFYLLLGEEIFIPDSARSVEKNKEKAKESSDDEVIIPRKILFLFSDAYSVDDPRPAARRLCENDIIPVLIGTGRVNIRGQDDLTSFCGLSFGIDIPVPEVIHALKIHLGLIKNDTASTTALPTLPTKPALSTRTSTTTTTTIRSTTTTTTIEGPRPYSQIPPEPRKFNYAALAGLLVAIGFIECLILGSILHYHCCLPASAYSRPSDSEETINLEAESSSSDLRVGEVIPRKTSLKQKNRLGYPSVVNSFFTRHAALDVIPKKSSAIVNLKPDTFKEGNPCCSGVEKNTVVFSDTEIKDL